MNVNELRLEFELLLAERDPAAYIRFMKKLLSSDKPEVVAIHFDLLGRAGDHNLAARLRASFLKRGGVAEEFLLDRFQARTEAEEQEELLALLGEMGSVKAVPLARQLLGHPNGRLRTQSIQILAAAGGDGDSGLLADRLENDPDAEVRAAAARGLRRLARRFPDVRPSLIGLLAPSLAEEKEPEPLALVLILAQDLLEAPLGLREISEGREITGDLEKARKKARKALKSLKAPEASEPP